MRADELEAFRAILRAQAQPSPRGRLAQRVLRRVAGDVPASLGVLDLDFPTPVTLPRAPVASAAMFGRREPEPPPVVALPPPPPPERCGPLLLTTLLPPADARAAPLEPGQRVALRVRDEADAEAFSTPGEARPGATRDSSVTVSIGGWSVRPPPSARARRLARIAAVCDAERRGLDARLASLGL